MFNRTVIIVDDSESDRILFTRYLNQIGFECICYENAEKLIAGIEGLESGLILMDIELPGISGFDAAKILKNRQKTSDSKHIIIALTAHNSNNFVNRLAESGFDDFIQKPITKKELQKRISKFMAQDSGICPHTLTAKSAVGNDNGKLYSLNMFDEDEPEFIRSIVEIFVSDTPVALKAIRTAYEEDKMEVLKFNAHKLKPHFGFFGASNVQLAMQKIEDIGRGLEEKDDLAELIACVEKNSALIIAQLKEDILS